MSSAGFELVIPAIERPDAYAFDRAATRIGEFTCILFVIAIVGERVSLGM
jgi:hypothetical protein